jgi:hypothetical protein
MLEVRIPKLEIDDSKFNKSKLFYISQIFLWSKGLIDKKRRRKRELCKNITNPQFKPK